MYEHFSSRFKFMAKTKDKGVAGYQPMEVTTEINLSATWKGLGQGGGAKVHGYPCHCCGIHLDNLSKVAGSQCDRWCQQHNNLEFMCYHQGIVTNKVLWDME